MGTLGGEVATVIAACAQLLIACAAVGSAALSWKNGRAIEVIHHATNSLKDELVKEVRKAAKAEGIAAGVVQERANPQMPVTSGER